MVRGVLFILCAMIEQSLVNALDTGVSIKFALMTIRTSVFFLSRQGGKIMNDNYCADCGKNVPISIRNKKVTLKYNTRMITYDELYAVCQFCGNEVYDPKVENMNSERRAFALSAIQ